MGRLFYSGRVPAQDREDLGAMFAWITRRLIDAEEPLLAARGLTMWEYTVLSHLIRRPAPSQLRLASDIRYDKTRLITLLDRLEDRGLVSRRPDPNDRRSHPVSITAAGRELHAAARAQIRDMEADFLDVLDARQQAALLAILPRLAPPPGTEAQTPLP
jgi:DNA-binding MarR family transcriptional regulator